MGRLINRPPAQVTTRAAGRIPSSCCRSSFIAVVLWLVHLDRQDEAVGVVASAVRSPSGEENAGGVVEGSGTEPRAFSAALLHEIGLAKRGAFYSGDGIMNGALDRRRRAGSSTPPVPSSSATELGVGFQCRE